MKTTLPNNNGKISLKNPDGKIASQISYEKAKEGKSLSLVKISDGNVFAYVWLWLKPSPNLLNPPLFEIKGEIMMDPKITENYEFYINNKKIIIPEEIFDEVKILLKKGSLISALIDENNVLHEFHIQTKNVQGKKISKNPKWTHYMIIPISILLSLLIGLKRVPWHP